MLTHWHIAWLLDSVLLSKSIGHCLASKPVNNRDSKDLLSRAKRALRVKDSPEREIVQAQPMRSW